MPQKIHDRIVWSMKEKRLVEARKKYINKKSSAIAEYAPKIKKKLCSEAFLRDICPYE